MSFPVTTTTGLRVTGLNESNGTVFDSGMCLGMWVRVNSSGTTYVRGINLYSDADGSKPRATLGVYPSNRSPWMQMSSGSGFEAIHSASDFTNNAWVLVWANWDATSGDITVGFGDMTGTTNSGDAGWEDWGSSATKAIGIGVQRHENGLSDEFAFEASGTLTSLKIALPFIVKRKATTTASTGEIALLAAGDHPAAVFGADLLDYWPLDSKTSGINGWVLSDVGGSITIDTGDNPTVDDPPAGGGDEEAALAGSASTGGHGTASPVFSIGL